MVQHKDTPLSKTKFCIDILRISGRWQGLPEKEKKAVTTKYDSYFRAYFRTAGRIAKRKEYFVGHELSIKTEAEKKEALKAYKRYYQKEYRHANKRTVVMMNILSRSEFLEKFNVQKESPDDVKEYYNKKYDEYYQKEYQKRYKRKGDRHRLQIELTKNKSDFFKKQAKKHKQFSSSKTNEVEEKPKNLGQFIIACAEAYLENKLVHRDPDLLKEFIKQFKGASKNINEMAKQAARKGYAERLELDMLHKKVNRMRAIQVQYFETKKDLLYSIEEEIKRNSNFLTELEQFVSVAKNKQANDNQE